MSRVTRQHVESLVQAAVENLRAGRAVEDDSGLELKGDWPDPKTKARQLAGAANSLRGRPLIYAIGVHDETGAVTTPERIEPQNWHAQLEKQFDQLAPGLLWTQTVYVGDDSESVQVLVFDTSEFPYVVKTPDNRLEVPIRRATGTRSAHRSDLIRIMTPRVAVPEMWITTARLSAYRTMPSTGESEHGGSPPLGRVDGSLQVKVFIEQLGGGPTTLPVDLMRGRVRYGPSDTKFIVGVTELGQSRWPVMRRLSDPPPPLPVPPQYGVYARDRHVVATAPGTFSIDSHIEFEPEPPTALDEVLTTQRLLASLEAVEVDLVLRVVGGDRDVSLSATLRQDPPAPSTQAASSSNINVWSLDLPMDDPWGEPSTPQQDAV